jgi:hypothetical protein
LFRFDLKAWFTGLCCKGHCATTYSSALCFNYQQYNKEFHPLLLELQNREINFIEELTHRFEELETIMYAGLVT